MLAPLQYYVHARTRYFTSKLELPHVAPNARAAGMSTMKISATAKEVQSLLSFDEDQWERFYRITLLEGDKLDDSIRSWGDVRSDHKGDILARVKALLAAERIPQIGRDALRWRMSQVLKNRARRQSTSPSLVASQRLMETARLNQSSNPNPGPSAALADGPGLAQTEQDKPFYDPVRD